MHTSNEIVSVIISIANLFDDDMIFNVEIHSLIHPKATKFTEKQTQLFLLFFLGIGKISYFFYCSFGSHDQNKHLTTIIRQVV